MSMNSNDAEIPIDSFEEFLRRQKLVEWPETIRKYVQLPSDYHFNSVEEIDEYLKKMVPFPVEIATSISTLVDEVWGRVKENDAILSKSIIKPTGCRTRATPKSNNHPYPDLVAKAHKKIKEQIETVPLCPDVMDFEFPGFSNLEHTDIPGLPSTSLHLDHISEAQGFNPGFLKIWKPFFLSEHSIIVFKDTFWWFFLHRFKPSPEDESALFDSIATGFVSLLLMVFNDVKDKLFKVYADCLAQAIYAAFCGAFPQSKEHFHDDFKTELTEVTSLWVSGVKPKLLSWKNWKLQWSTPAKDAVKTKKASVCDFQADLTERIASAMRSGVVQAHTPTISRRSCAEVGSHGRNRESHYIGPGPQFDHIYFKPWGQSPLVARYLQLHGIPSTAGSSSRKVKRTEIATVPPEKPTYQEVISETQGKISKWRWNYNQFSKQTNEAIAGIHKRRHLKFVEINRLQKQLMNRAEIKIYSDGIMNKWHCAADSTNHRHRLKPSAGQKGDSDESRNAEENPKAPEQPGEQA
ncbi:protein FAM227B-like isoform X1 [Alosa sapidissima]|uniref:protein FAM227B-like isoform X1 n=2 Tax=Alosa sapidissima TaxID=34773 RepID=UPI001C08B40A|nr:protein FAM227B-like isoform X1 [Alosa sapidissima]